MPPTLTPEQLALREARRLKKLASQNASTSDRVSLNPHAKILKREWARLRAPQSPSSSVRVMTWNMLAQTLVRRDLFPSSDCLRATQRGLMLSNEITSYDPDIACLQEVDAERSDELALELEKKGYQCTYGTGLGKRHGCMVAHRTSKFKRLTERVISLDSICLVDISTMTSSSTLNHVSNESTSKGLTRKTKNIALIVALSTHDQGLIPKGYIAVTCHLFWHPRYVYERARQGAIIRREVLDFQKKNNLLRWPVFFAGDFNCQPTEALYNLLVRNPLTARHAKDISASHVIHMSIDPSIQPSSASTEKGGEEEGEEGAAAISDAQDRGGENAEGKEKEEPDPDRVFTNTRNALPEDGLMSAEELEKIFWSFPPLRSAYDEGHDKIFGLGVTSGSLDLERTFAARLDEKDKLQYLGRKGMNEPMYTNFTHYWRLTLDYIFIQDPLIAFPADLNTPNLPLSNNDHASSQALGIARPKGEGEIIALLRTHRAEDLEPGLPKLGVCASDHIALCAEIEY
ncbi:Endonuclease/exonuclease/phosphatase [Cantharellus anzutake]|uniref:Endonuclease/exonuclease/phosphatase n=1 Tax=Cantharellus anzutake TaxID=1750568 RepID=UPI001907CD4F|nr:Endonuclease/exonuclease/phosphatase [Cantharellus anzutake]KAF8332341.1 Endonuclease/exonuclease/phosphatase [Cantharellus anzutake]